MGTMNTIGDLTDINKTFTAKSIYRKNQKRVVYVVADMAGELESPVYAILGMSDKLKEIDIPEGYKLEELYIKQPDFEDDYTIKWDGEWQVTLEVFRGFGNCISWGYCHYLYFNSRVGFKILRHP